MRISVVTICRNSAGTVEDTLRSVASQTHADIEHIIVDGNSTDDTMERVWKYRDRLAHVISEPDQGIYDAMNKGVEVATGEVVGFLNADDVYADAGVLSRVADIMGQEGVDAVYGDVAFFRSEKPGVNVRRYRSANFSPRKIARGLMPAHPSLYLRREVFERCGNFSTDYRIAGDFEFIARIFGVGGLRCWYLPEVMVRMRLGGVSTGGWRNTLLLNMEVLRACRANDVPTNIFLILSKYPAKLLEYIFK
jgi:glycosyltransferase involved in cell wall biosynthesis